MLILPALAKQILDLSILGFFFTTSMPRRPSKSKGKFKVRPVNRSEGKLKRWDKLSDIPMDDEDQCAFILSLNCSTPPIFSVVHASRDKILLEGDDSGGDDDGDEDEVFELKGQPKGHSDDEGNGSDDESQDDIGTEDRLAPKSKPKTPKGKKLVPSESSESESEEETWGRNKTAYYSSNAAQLESDDEEANELEEQEARRLQAKARDAMGDDDFGLYDSLETAGGLAETE